MRYRSKYNPFIGVVFLKWYHNISAPVLHIVLIFHHLRTGGMIIICLIFCDYLLIIWWSYHKYLKIMIIWWSPVYHILIIKWLHYWWSSEDHMLIIWWFYNWLWYVYHLLIIRWSSYDHMMIISIKSDFFLLKFI